MVQISGRVFSHRGKKLTGSTKRKCWKRVRELVGFRGVDLRCWRHTFKSNAAHSGMDETIRNAIMGHANHLPVADLYIHIPDEKLVAAVDSMTFDHGETHFDYSGGEKSDAKMTPNLARKEKRQVAV